MSTVWIDPVELHETSTLLSNHAERIGALGGDLVATCGCVMPPAVAASVMAELSSVQTSALEVGLGYELGALELVSRSDTIVNDQSLAGAATTAYGGETTLASQWLAPMEQGESASSGWPGSTDWLGGLDTAGGGTFGATTGGWLDPMEHARVLEGWQPDVSTWTIPTRPAGSIAPGSGGLALNGGASMYDNGLGYIADVSSGSGLAGTTLAPLGINVEFGTNLYVDGGGNKSNSLTDAATDQGGYNHIYPSP